jgi:hypothetical protein
MCEEQKGPTVLGQSKIPELVSITAGTYGGRGVKIPIEKRSRNL